MRSQCHPFSQTRNHECIGHSEQGEVLIECQILGVEEDHRLVGECRETGVDARDNISNTALQFILARGLEGNLDEDGLWSGE